MFSTRFSAWCFGALLLFWTGSAHALEDFVNRVPNPLRVNGQGCVTCHNNPAGGQGCGNGTPYPQVTKCFNPFGEAFALNNRVWNETLAALDSDGDGFTNGQELQDPAGTWRFLIDSPTRGTTSCVSAPGFANTAALPVGVSLRTDPGADGDADGYCCVGRDLDANRDCRAPNERSGQNATVGDCDDAANLVNPEAKEVCLGSVDQDCDGALGIADSECAYLVDNDGDGYCEVGKLADNADRFCTGPGEMGGAVDCNDAAATAFPFAPESCFDGLDNDCNMATDLDDESCSAARALVDTDGDGFCLLGRDLSQPPDGDCADVGENTQPFDCNDAAKGVSPAAIEDCRDQRDNDCNGKADLEDPACQSLVDLDGDGFCSAGRDLSDPRDGDCTDSGEAGGAAIDCDDTAATSYPGAPEICIDDKDNDCDGAASIDDTDCVRFVDRDGDGYCSEGWDLDGDGDCNSGLEPAGPGDCNDAQALVSPKQAEECTDSIDNDCDGRTDGSDQADCGKTVDRDRDGYCEVGRDLNGDRDCGDEGEPALASDCDTEDATRYPNAPEVCFDGLDNDCNSVVDLDDPQCARNGVGSVDADGDGSCPIGVDRNSDGDCSDAQEGIKALSDCNDRNPAVHVGADEICDDALDNDCDFLVDLDDRESEKGFLDPASCARVLDRDRDSFCPMGRDRNGDGDCLDVSETAPASDCDDDNPQAFPGFAEVCTDRFDNDCDGKIDLSDPECPCDDDVLCDDQDACTRDRCGSAGCVHEPMCGPDAGAMPGEADGGMSNSPTVDAGAAPPGPLRLNNGCALSARTREQSGLSVWFLLAFVIVGPRVARRCAGGRR